MYRGRTTPITLQKKKKKNYTHIYSKLLHRAKKEEEEEKEYPLAKLLFCMLENRKDHHFFHSDNKRNMYIPL